MLGNKKINQLEDYFSIHKFDKSEYEDLNEHEMFSLFYSNLDLALVLNWIESNLQEHTLPKDNITSAEFRKLGNSEFKAEKTKNNSIKYYNRSLAFAEFNSKEYALALANRSVVSFSNNCFDDCLKDIDLCLESGNYPEELQHKILIRRLYCYYYLQLMEKFNEEMKVLQEKLNDNDQFKEFFEKYKSDLLIIKESSNFLEEKVPEMEKNNDFLYASYKIQLSQNNKLGRYVTAKEDIKSNELLFIEPAFAVAPIFRNRENLVTDKCYNCLKSTQILIPCKECTLCLYCDASCRDASWNGSHQYECPGMVLWYDLGIGLPAFKCLHNGLQGRFKVLDNDDHNSALFGNAKDNYPYFNSLLSHLENVQNLEHFLLIAATISLYLTEKTSFFHDVADRLSAAENSEQFVGGLLVKHIAQLTCNSSIVMHRPSAPHGTSAHFELMDEVPVACGIYPSISMMNHSCNSNITLRYINSVAIVKAKEDVIKGEEICNCYGVDYRIMCKKDRQKALRDLYFFNCQCSICKDSAKEIVK